MTMQLSLEFFGSADIRQTDQNCVDKSCLIILVASTCSQAHAVSRQHIHSIRLLELKQQCHDFQMRLLQMK